MEKTAHKKGELKVDMLAYMMGNVRVPSLEVILVVLMVASMELLMVLKKETIAVGELVEMKDLK